ncbi:MAG: TlpA disulfide reductase family protein [Paludibacter sp.]|nr:TlpA disulfide reductase family protein [Paludibacter sp.]
MKKNLFYLLALLLLIGCTNNSFKIEGSVNDDSLNGQTVYLKDRINGEWVNLDSTIISDKKFSFKGTADTIKTVYMLTQTASGEKLRNVLILEPGTINIVYENSEFVINGTPQNEILNQYISIKNNLYKEIEAYYKSTFKPDMNSDEKTQFEQKMDVYNQKDKDIDIDYATRNVNTEVGTYIFASSYYNMNVSEKENITSLMNESTRQKERIHKIIENIAIEKQTAVGEHFTDIKLPSITGDSLALSDLVGKTDYVLIDFWATWCGPCMRSMPDMKDLYNKYKGQKLEVLGVSLDQDETAWKKIVKEKELSWKHISDLAGWQSQGAKLYAINSIPATVLIDKNGIIKGRNLSHSELENILSK